MGKIKVSDVAVMLLAIVILSAGTAFAAPPTKGPKILSVEPARAPSYGGTQISIVGKSFLPGASVFFGATPAKNVFFVSSTNLVVTTPFVSKGIISLSVRNPNGTSADFSGFEFYYNGDGFFSDDFAVPSQGSSFENYHGTLADFDNDGDLDLFAPQAVIGSQHQLFLNNGAGTFTDVSATHLPVITAGAFDGVEGDIDGDGDLDLVLTGRSMTYPQGNPAVNKILINNGAGIFTDETAQRFPFDWVSSSVVLGDIDGDNDLDIFWGASSTTYSYKLFENQGNGTFIDATTTKMPGLFPLGNSYWDSCQAVSMADFDNDGDLEILLSAYGKKMLLTNNGSGFFTDASFQLGTIGHQGFDIDIADLDGDHDLDIVFSDYDGAHFAKNDGYGYFTDATAQFPVNASRALGSALFDMDGDGDTDLMVATSYGAGVQNLLMENNGLGWFSDATNLKMPQQLDNAFELEFGDIDKDGDLDLFVARGYSEGSSFYINKALGE